MLHLTLPSPAEPGTGDYHVSPLSAKGLVAEYSIAAACNLAEAASENSQINRASGVKDDGLIITTAILIQKARRLLKLKADVEMRGRVVGLREGTCAGPSPSANQKQQKRGLAPKPPIAFALSPPPPP